MPITKSDCGLKIVWKGQGLLQGAYSTISRYVGRITRLVSQSVSRIWRCFQTPQVGVTKATFSFKRAIDKGTRRPPHLVSADELLWRESRLAVGRALDAELTHPVAKGVGMEIQDSRRTLRPINHSICLLKGSQDMASLHFFQRGQ